MNIGEEIYKAIKEHCGDTVVLKGVTWQSLKNMKEGKSNPTLSTIGKIFKANNMPAELVITIKKEGKTGKTKIKI